VSDLAGYFAQAPAITQHRPWPRVELDAAGWHALVEQLAREPWELTALWADPPAIHVCLRDAETGTLIVASHATPDGAYESLGRVRPSALRLERAARDLFGLVAEGTADSRPWLDHGRWPMRMPLGTNPVPRRLDEPAARAVDYPFLPVEGEALHQIPVGPVHAGIIEPGHFRFHANGETVVRLEERLGWTHKGIEGLMRGKTPLDAARIACRISGDSAVAHALAFARAVEAAVDQRPPPRADFLRALMAEIERIANHLGDFGAICNDASFVFLQAEATTLREQMLRLAGKLFGHRLMMDAVVPGGVARDLDWEGAEALRAHVDQLGPAFEKLVKTYDNRPSLLDRTMATGVTAAHLVRRFAAGGFVGRGSGRGDDARRTPGYPPYDQLDFEIPVQHEGDVHARVWIRIREIRASLKLIREMLAQLPTGAIRVELPTGAGREGMAIVEGFRGDVFGWVRLDGQGLIARYHPRDPSWFQWPLLEAAIEGNIVADFPLCNKSFNCSYSGQDL